MSMPRAQCARRVIVHVGPSRLYDYGAMHCALTVDERTKQAQPGAYQYRRGHDPQCTAELEHASTVTPSGPNMVCDTAALWMPTSTSTVLSRLVFDMSMRGWHRKSLALKSAPPPPMTAYIFLILTGKFWASREF